MSRSGGPPATAELAYAENNTGVAQAGLTNGTFDITGCSITVPPSSRPVYLEAYAALNVTAGGAAGTILRLVIVEVGGAGVTIEGDGAVGTSTGVETVVIPPTRIGPTNTTRTFKLQVVVSATVTITAANGGTSRRSVLAGSSR